ncbi:Protein Ycf2 [Frankliniella fusca]|uniref:Protein Ycf2 n=1 Tax=Frankliniella fusca TaxID=407009 RepID=A0AAE1H5B8_9NEOP|nr:Protein Ycf2 [Frankliniella fusca]
MADQWARIGELTNRDMCNMVLIFGECGGRAVEAAACRLWTHSKGTPTHLNHLNMRPWKRFQVKELNEADLANRAPACDELMDRS